MNREQKWLAAAQAEPELRAEIEKLKTDLAATKATAKGLAHELMLVKKRLLLHGEACVESKVMGARDFFDMLNVTEVMREAGVLHDATQVWHEKWGDDIETPKEQLAREANACQPGKPDPNGKPKVRRSGGRSRNGGVGDDPGGQPPVESIP
jgi:hypothetical protein